MDENKLKEIIGKEDLNEDDTEFITKNWEELRTQLGEGMDLEDDDEGDLDDDDDFAGEGDDEGEPTEPKQKGKGFRYPSLEEGGKPGDIPIGDGGQDDEGPGASSPPPARAEPTARGRDPQQGYRPRGVLHYPSMEGMTGSKD